MCLNVFYVISVYFWDVICIKNNKFFLCFLYMYLNKIDVCSRLFLYFLFGFKNF